MNRERDLANPTPEELRETAASEGWMATEEETAPEFDDDRQSRRRSRSRDGLTGRLR